MGTTDSASLLAEEAISWLSLFRSGNATPRDYAQFRVWRSADPRHNQAWHKLTTSIDGATLDHTDTTGPVIATPPSSYNRRRFLTGIGLLAAGSAAAYTGNLVYPWERFTSDASTGTAERRHYVLSDGTTLLLDARSALNLTYTPYLRQLTLQSGAVTIDSTHDRARPFLTRTTEGLIRSHGARYMVRQYPHRTLVVAHDQPVEIETRGGVRKTLSPGMGIRFDASRIGDPTEDMAAGAAWEHGRIDARGVTLSEVVQALRPYYSGALRVTTAAGGLPVSGSYSLDDVNSTLHHLTQQLPISVQRFTPWLTSIAVAPSA